MYSNFLKLVFILFCIFQESSIWASSENKKNNNCKLGYYVVGFFNGVWNTKFEADRSKEKLEALIGKEYNGKKVKYELFYNDTGANVGSTALQDILEVFIQRGNEIDNSGTLSERFEALWDVINGSAESTSIFDDIKNTSEEVSKIVEKLYEKIAADSAAAIAKIFSNPPAESNYMEQSSKLDKLAEAEHSLLLIGHSQGNLFLNHAYDYIQSKIKSEQIAAVHITPASPTLRGNYILSDHDVVINLLRIQGLLSVPSNNISLFTKDDQLFPLGMQ